MYCPKCGTKNLDASKFCLKCGKALQTALIPVSQKRPFTPPPILHVPKKPANMMAKAATTGGVAGMVGGGLIVLGWLLPWSSVGLGNGPQILGFLAIGSLISVAASSLLGMVSDSLNSSDISGLINPGASNLMSDVPIEEIGALFIVLAIVVALLVILIPISGFICARRGIWLFELRAYTGTRYASQVRQDIQRIRDHATNVLGLLFLVFVILSLVPLGFVVLGIGYWLMVLGSVISFTGALFARSQVGPEITMIEHKTTSGKGKTTARLMIPGSIGQPPDTPGSSAYEISARPQLTEREDQVLALLARQFSNLQIADRLNVSSIEASTLTMDLLEKFGAVDKTELIKLAQVKGYLPPG